MLEVEFKKQEQKRLEREKLKTLVKQGISFENATVDEGMLTKLESLQKHFNSLPLEPLNTLTELFKQRVSLLEELKEQQHFSLLELMKEANDDFKWITDTLFVIVQSTKSASDKMDDVFTELIADLAERKKLRAKQKDTLEKIDAYLERWG